MAISYYDRRLDRMIDHSGGSLGTRSGGFHRWMMDEVELGARAALGLDEEQCWGASLMIFWLMVAAHDPMLTGPNVVESITCPQCERISWNPNDVREGYCGACHDWTGQ